MKIARLLPIVLLTGMSFTAELPAYQGDNIEFACMKMHKATNTCHFNFKVDGAKFRYVDLGCKFGKSKEEAIKKVKEGTLALAKDWKIECPEPVKKDTVKSF